MTKEEARKQYNNKRMNENEVALKSTKIKDLLFSRLMMHRFSPIHVFLPIIEKKEVDTWEIIKTLQEDFAPEKYISKSQVNGEMLHFELKPDTKLLKNKWGILEPESNLGGLTNQSFFEKYKSEDILVLIPLLIFDKKGHRVGYGKGFYDRFLSFATLKTTKVGLSFYESIDEIENVNANDIKLDFCITPERVWKF